MRYVVTEIAGKQLKLSEGDKFFLDKNTLDNGVKTVSFDKVLLLRTDTDTLIGTPYLAGIKVSCQVLDKMKKVKVVAETFKAKSRVHKKIGSKTVLQELLVNKINTGNEEEKPKEIEKKPRSRPNKKTQK